MPKTVWATFRQGKVELLEQMDIADGARILVTIAPDEEDKFWFQTSQVCLDAVWILFGIMMRMRYMPTTPKLKILNN
jgi:hypothetical protein